MNASTTSNAGGSSGKADVDTDWDDLVLFQLHPDHAETVTTPVYANGRQQAQVKVEIIAEKDGEVVTLTESQLKRITLVAYDTGAPLPESVTTSCEQSALYEISLELFEDDVLAEIFEPRRENHAFPTDAQEQSLWVSCTTVGRYKVAAKLTSPSGVSYTTCPGPFDSWMNISAHAPLVHDWDTLKMGDRQDLIKTSDSPDYDVDMYFIKFDVGDLRIVDSIHHNHTADHPFYSWPQPRWPRMSSVAFQVSQPREVIFPPGVTEGCKFKVNTRPGQANAARVQHRTTHGLKQSFEFGKVTYFDQYGNSVPAVIAVAGDGNTLHLQSTGPHPLPDPPGKGAAGPMEKLD